nr:sn1-specific diacylglycerol lipase alpha isoform X1 [Onthophagus taurus]
MPGIVVFNRRWGVGSDDLVVPGVFLFIVHAIWLIILCVLLGLTHFDITQDSIKYLFGFLIGYLAVLIISMVSEICIIVVSLRGNILDTKPRAPMQYILYVRVVLLIIEAGWLAAGIVWSVYFYQDCPMEITKQFTLGLVVCNWCIIVSILVTVWCTYDAAGRSWVKMKNYQRSMRESESKFQYKRSGSNRNWRQRKVLRAYQDSWHQRCRFLFCCMRGSDRNRNSFTDIARLLSDFFRDLDVVPSDVIAGLVLLRKFQKIERRSIIEQRKNETYEFLSGVPVTPRTQFLALHEGGDLELFQTVIHYAYFAVGAYGWPIYVMTEKLGACKLCSNFGCCCVPCQKRDNIEIIEDNCCACNYAALEKIISKRGNIEVIYATYHVDVGETPFYVALDFDRKKVVVSIRGTLSMKDILTDLNAESETLPLDPPQEEWLGHKGMVQAAQYILDKLRGENLLEKAFDYSVERGTKEFQLVLVGHSLGAGTACILGILLRQEYQDLLCYCYSPPGGLLSMPAVEYTKSFIISVVIGKDVVPRIGLHQMEALRSDLINAIKRSVDPKWKTISCSICCNYEPTSAVQLSTDELHVQEYMTSKNHARNLGLHPSDSSIALTSHNPLYPPGRIIHVVRHHPTKGEQKYENQWRQKLSKKEPVYQALWAQNTDFDEVLISPVMIQDHMPDKVVDALNKVVTTMGPRKPSRIASISQEIDTQKEEEFLAPTTTKIYLETSFAASSSSSLTNGLCSTSESSPLPLANVISLLNQRKSFEIIKKSKSRLSLNVIRTLNNENNKRIDFIHDDWYGLAPLASPESLSEVSSIASSKASFQINMEKAEMLLKTPLVMRRTPKIINNLSTCADDIRNVRYFQKLGQLSRHLRRPSQNGSPITNSSSSNLSFQSANSNKSEKSETVDVIAKKMSSDEYQSAEEILEQVIETAGCSEFFSGAPKINLEDTDVLPNFAIDLNLSIENRSEQFLQISSKLATTQTFLTEPKPILEVKNVTFNPEVVNIESSPKKPKKPDKWNLKLPTKSKKIKAEILTLPTSSKSNLEPKTILCVKKQDSPNFVRRKKYVYPTVDLPLAKDESSL